MKKHSGMRPHDIVVLLKIAAKKDAPWLMKDLANELGISGSEISESLHRSSLAGLITKDKQQLMKLSILDFLEHGLRYVYPQQPGAKVRGVPTAHAAAPLSELILSDEAYVWPCLFRVEVCALLNHSPGLRLVRVLSLPFVPAC